VVMRSSLADRRVRTAAARPAGRHGPGRPQPATAIAMVPGAPAAPAPCRCPAGPGETIWPGAPTSTASWATARPPAAAPAPVKLLRGYHYSTVRVLLFSLP